MAIGVMVDANVLYSRTLRDWLFLLRNATEANMFVVHATEDVIAETLYRLRRNHPDWPGQLTTEIHDRISENIDCRVRNYTIDGSYPGVDPDDAHVHAAAVASGVGVLLTGDTGFTTLSEEVKDALPYEIHTPDSFFTLVAKSSPISVHQVTEQQVTYWMRRHGKCDLPARLRAADCPDFAEQVRQHVLTIP